jgi:DNA replication ATP-dependent helicase Dna2
MSVESDDQAAAEAACIVRLATMLFEQAEKVGLELDLGVITPFRIQNARIRDLLPSSIRDIVTVDTVERFQGSERDIIIYGTAVSTSADLASIEAEIMVHGRSVDRKLNVAMTRARSQLVVVGNERVLATSAAYREVLSGLHHMSCPSA